MWKILKHLTVWPIVGAIILYHFLNWGKEIPIGLGSLILTAGLMILCYFLGIMWHIIYMGMKVQSLNKALINLKPNEFIANLQKKETRTTGDNDGTDNPSES